MEVPAILFLGVWFFYQFLSGVGSITTVAANQGAGPRSGRISRDSRRGSLVCLSSGSLNVNESNGGTT